MSPGLHVYSPVGGKGSHGVSEHIFSGYGRDILRMSTFDISLLTIPNRWPSSSFFMFYYRLFIMRQGRACMF